MDVLTHLIITVIPYLRPECRGNARWLGIHPDVIQDAADMSAMHDEGNDARVATTGGAHQGDASQMSSSANTPAVYALLSLQKRVTAPMLSL